MITTQLSLPPPPPLPFTPSNMTTLLDAHTVDRICAVLTYVRYFGLGEDAWREVLGGLHTPDPSSLEVRLIRNVLVAMLWVVLGFSSHEHIEGSSGPYLVVIIAIHLLGMVCIFHAFPALAMGGNRLVVVLYVASGYMYRQHVYPGYYGLPMEFAQLIVACAQTYFEMSLSGPDTPPLFKALYAVGIAGHRVVVSWAFEQLPLVFSGASIWTILALEIVIACVRLGCILCARK